jgi:glycerol uptake facilitator-like aquaporin
VLARRALAEFLGTGLLVTVVVGSGIAAARLSPHDVGIELLENAAATAAGLFALILMLGPVSGAHFNPVVSAADAWLGRRSGGLRPGELLVYIAAQVSGAVAGAVLANLMFGMAAASWSHKSRSAGHLWLAEAVATGGLVLLIFALARSGQSARAPAAVGAYIGAAYWFTSSTSFANPAVTAGRMFSNSFAGISPSSAPAFIGFQAVGLVAGVVLVIALYPRSVERAEADVVVAHEAGGSGPLHAVGERP